MPHPINPCFATHARRLERVQHKFLRAAAYKLGLPMARIDHDYSRTAEALGIPSLVSLRQLEDMVTLHKIIKLPGIITPNPFSRFSGNSLEKDQLVRRACDEKHFWSKISNSQTFNPRQYPRGDN